MNKDFYKAINYIVLLIILVLIFHTSKTILKKYDIKINLELKETYLEYFYIFFFAIISGLLLFFGFKYFNNTINYFLKNQSLAEVTSATIVIAFSFLYSAYFQDILQLLFGVDINIDVWKNIIGYVLGRLILILIIYFY